MKFFRWIAGLYGAGIVPARRYFEPAVEAVFVDGRETL